MKIFISSLDQEDYHRALKWREICKTQICPEYYIIFNFLNDQESFAERVIVISGRRISLLMYADDMLMLSKATEINLKNIAISDIWK